MDLQNNVRVFLICVSLSFPHSDCKVIGTTSTTATLTPATTTTPRPYPGFGIKLDFEVTDHIWKGTEEVKENAYPWMAFIYSSYVRTVLDWVKIVTGMEYHAGNSDPGESQEY